MYKKITQLSFVIGLFFSLVSIILFVNALVNQSGNRISIYTGISFLAFGLLMIYLSNKEKADD